MNKPAALDLAQFEGHTPMFRFDEHSPVVGAFTLKQMLQANSEDQDVCEWCSNAKVGDLRAFGGGAYALWNLRRIA